MAPTLNSKKFNFRRKLERRGGGGGRCTLEVEGKMHCKNSPLPSSLLEHFFLLRTLQKVPSPNQYFNPLLQVIFYALRPAVHP